MSHIPSKALSTAVDTFLSSLFGSHNFRRWQQMKDKLNLLEEHEFVAFLLDATEEKLCYRSLDSGLNNNNCEVEKKISGGCSLLQDAAKKQVVILDGDSDCVIDHCEPLTRTVIAGESSNKTSNNHAVNATSANICLDQSATAIINGDGSGCNNLDDDDDDYLDDDTLVVDCGDIDDDDDGTLDIDDFADMYDEYSIDGDDIATPTTLAEQADPDAHKEEADNNAKEAANNSPAEINTDPDAFAYSKSMGLISVGDSRKEPKCQYCGKRYSTWTNARRHEANVHLGIRRYKCAHCTRAFSEKHKLNRHVQCVHLKLRQFTCEYCGKEFSQLYSLRYHAKVCDSGQYRCTHCAQPFSNGEELFEHLERQHEQERMNRRIHVAAAADEFDESYDDGEIA